jgi:RNase adaptor protein for sRNA GlmZ degradation
VASDAGSRGGWEYPVSMAGSLVVLTGASGAGKTAIAIEVERLNQPDLLVFRFDTIGIPSLEEMASYGTGDQPGGAWQRAMTLAWFERIKPVLEAGTNVLFEGQMRIAFIREALAASRIESARIVLVDCNDEVRIARLTHHRLQPELAHANMMNWARYLLEEADQEGCEILDTSSLSLKESVAKVFGRFHLQDAPAY